MPPQRCVTSAVAAVVGREEHHMAVELWVRIYHPICIYFLVDYDFSVTFEFLCLSFIVHSALKA